MSTELVNLVRQVREVYGRPMDEAMEQRVRTRVHGMTTTEVNEQRATLKALLHAAGRMPAVTKNRDKP